MFISTVLAYVVARHMWKWSVLKMIVLLGPISVMDTAFLASNLFKIPEGAWVAIAFGAGMVDGHVDLGAGRAHPLGEDPSVESVPLAMVINGLARHPLYRQRGTAMFLTASPGSGA